MAAAFALAAGLLGAAYAVDRYALPAPAAPSERREALYVPNRFDRDTGYAATRTDFTGAPELIKGESWALGVDSLGADTVFDPHDPDGPTAARYRAPCFVRLSIADARDVPIVPPPCDRKIAFKPYITST